MRSLLQVTNVVTVGAVHTTGANFGAGIGRIVFDEVRCNGSEQRLVDCARASNHVNCYSGHREDSGVRCLARTGDDLGSNLTITLQVK